MYYHVRIKTSNNTVITKLDVADLSEIKLNVLTPYLQDIEFILDGHNLSKNKIDSISITESDDHSTECANIASASISMGDRTVISREACVFGNNKFSKDITSQIIAEVERLLPKTISNEVVELKQADDELSDSLIALTDSVRLLLKNKAESPILHIKILLVLGLFVFYGVVAYLWWIHGLEKIYKWAFVIIHVVLPGFLIILYIVTNRHLSVISLFEILKKWNLQRIYKKFNFDKVIDPGKTDQLTSLHKSDH